MITSNRRVHRREAANDTGPIDFQWADIYPLIGLLALVGYLILR